MMVWAGAFYLRGRPLLAGVVLAVGAAFKEVAPYALFALALLELVRVIARLAFGGPDQWRLRPALWRLFVATFVTAAGFICLLAIMGAIATPYADATGQLITGGPFDHLAHIISYAAQQRAPHGPTGIASYPWAWLVDQTEITYLRVNPSLPGHGLFAIHPVSKFLGLISPPILVGGLVGLVFAAYRLIRPAGMRRGDAVPWDSELPILAVSWFIGTWAPFALASLIDQRTSYLYYMLIVMPGIYVAAAYLASALWRLRRQWASALVACWGVAVLAATVLLYPFLPVF
jgi:hypothetical protein